MAPKGKDKYLKSGNQRKEAAIPDGACKICFAIKNPDPLVVAYDDTRIQCDMCNGYFHLHCEKCREKDPERIENFYCQECTGKHPEKVTTYHPRKKRRRTGARELSVPCSDSKASETSRGTFSSIDSPMTLLSTSVQTSKGSPTSASESFHNSSKTAPTVPDLMLTPSATSERAPNVSKPRSTHPKADASALPPASLSLAPAELQKVKKPAESTKEPKILVQAGDVSVDSREPKSASSDCSESSRSSKPCLCTASQSHVSLISRPTVAGITSGSPSPTPTGTKSFAFDQLNAASSGMPSMVSDGPVEGLQVAEAVTEGDPEVPVESLGAHQECVTQSVPDNERMDGEGRTWLTEKEDISEAREEPMNVEQAADDLVDKEVETQEKMRDMSVSRISLGLGETVISAEIIPRTIVARKAPQAFLDEIGELSPDEDEEDEEEKSVASNHNEIGVADVVTAHFEPSSDEREGSSSTASSTSSSSCTSSVSTVVDVAAPSMEVNVYAVPLHEITNKEVLARALRHDPFVQRQVDEIIVKNGSKLSREDIMVWFDHSGELDNVLKFRSMVASQLPKK
ncbi:hypothetical protein RvY_13046 [Ramazzottius varieornatus]|uniref:Zinc finger PHD-type domain-containing protein n=1 Tax=Ramazzottius varieornatus TaxID=947166 RepID=A0A1D1VLJ8_RAMVA|nr:hypothetical protein RvY_13046 [Ramazzottius varieornatus]